MFNFNNSLFSTQQKIEIPNSCKIIWVSDYFSNECSGGAEQTSDALIQKSPFEIFELKSKDVTVDLLKEGQNKYWIFTNISQMDWRLIPTIVANMKYSVVLFDYLYLCKYRSTDLHAQNERTPCDCHNESHGKIGSSMLYGAKSLWYMSEKQKLKFETMFPFLEEKESTVLSSVFSDKDLFFIKVLREKYKDKKNNKYLILDSTSWIKNTKGCIEYAERNNLEYELISGLTQEETLEKQARSKGLIFLPLSGDTCPRIVIQGKLLDCDLIINSQVEHASEEWWNQ